MKLLSIPDLPEKAGIVRPVQRPVDPDEMQMDQQTFRDLEIFDAAGGPGLFDLLDRTSTTGGSRALRARWRRPLSKRSRILGVQQSLRHITNHRKVFNLLPGEVVIAAVERYLDVSVPVINARNPLDLLTQPLEFRFSDPRQYWRIVTGVERTLRMVRALRRIVQSPELAAAPGVLESELTELRELLDRPAFADLPIEGDGELSCWRLMRVDRILRERERETITRLMQLIFELDALVSMADATRESGYVVPEVVDDVMEISAEGLYHPFVARPVRNGLRVDQSQRMLFLTGPNMAGKTTYLRAAGIALYLGHLGMGVPARSFSFTPCDNLFGAIALVDNVREGISFFRAEALRVKTIARAVAEGRRVVALLDEPFKGTNVKDALDASRAVLSRLAGKQGNLFLVASHLIELADALLDTGSVVCARFEAIERERLEFDYVLRPGVSSQRLGVRVLQEEGVFDLLAG